MHSSVALFMAAVAVSTAACSSGTDTANPNLAEDWSANETEAPAADQKAGDRAASGSALPDGSRIVLENGVTYRIDPSGARLALGRDDSRIVLEGGTRFRVDPDGTRVPTDSEGAVVELHEDGIDPVMNLERNTN